MDKQQSSLSELYQHHAGKVSAKWSSYLSLYDDYFAPYRDKPIQLLELGVQNGGSLEIWAEYFQNAKQFIACDIDPLCDGLVYDDPRVQLILGDINNKETYEQVISLSNQYDIIIDDASHRSGDIIQSFVNLFPLLSEGGLYVIEDLHCSYWQGYDGGLYDPHSAISFLKQCVDLVNHEHWGLPFDKRTVFDQGIEEKYHFQLKDIALQNIASVAFYNSVCVIKKGNPALGPLVVSGKEELVSKGNIELSGKQSKALDQSENIWSHKQSFDDANIIALTKNLQETKSQLEHSNVLLSHEKEVSAQKQAFMEKTCQQLSDEMAEHHALKAKFDELNSSNNYMQAENAKLLANLEKVNASVSWKITKPLRALRRIFDRRT